MLIHDVFSKCLAVSLLPAADGLPLQGLGTKLEYLDPDASGTSCISDHRIAARGSRLLNRYAALFERGRRPGEILDVHAEVRETWRPRGVDRLQFDERIPAHLDIGQRRLSFFISYRERFAETHLLGIEGQRFIEPLNGDSDVIHIVYAAEPVVLSNRRRYAQTD